MHWRLLTKRFRFLAAAAGLVVLLAVAAPASGHVQGGENVPADLAGAEEASGAAAAPSSGSPSLPPLTVDELVQHVQVALSGIETIEITVEVDQYSPADGGVTPGRGRLMAILPDLFRFDWLEPDMLAGSILLVDRGRNEARQYNPIREEIIVQRWDRLAAQQNLGQDLDRWISLPSQEDYELAAGGIGFSNGDPYYIVLARPRTDPRQLYEFFVHPETWMISQFRYYDVEGRLALAAALRDVRINAGLAEEHLRAMPEAIIRQR